MSAPTTTCHHCKTAPVVRRVAIPGSHPVDLGLCDCDYIRCPHPACKKVIRELAVPSTCPHCKGRM